MRLEPKDPVLPCLFCFCSQLKIPIKILLIVRSNTLTLLAYSTTKTILFSHKYVGVKHSYLIRAV